MQVVGIVRSLISAGPDDKLSHIENFRANEGWKFEYPSARLSFSRLSPSPSLFSRLSGRLSAIRAYLRLASVYNKSVIWFIERFLSRMQAREWRCVIMQPFIREIFQKRALNRWHAAYRLSSLQYLELYAKIIFLTDASSILFFVNFTNIVSYQYLTRQKFVIIYIHKCR